MDHLRNKNRRSIYLLDAQHQQIKEKAKEQGLSFSSYVCQSALSNKAPDLETKKQIKELYLELGRIGNNLNQIAYQLNKSNNHYPQALQNDLPEAISLLKDLRECLANDH